MQLFESGLFGVLAPNLKEKAACDLAAVRSPLKCLNSIKVNCVVLFLESFSGSHEWRKGTKHSELWIVWLIFFSHTKRARVSSHAHTGRHRMSGGGGAAVAAAVRRRCRVAIFSYARVSQPHDNCEFNWCCHMVCNGVSSDCRASVKGTHIFLEEKRRLSRAGIKEGKKKKKRKKMPLFD